LVHHGDAAAGDRCSLMKENASFTDPGGLKHRLVSRRVPGGFPYQPKGDADLDLSQVAQKAARVAKGLFVAEAPEAGLDARIIQGSREKVNDLFAGDEVQDKLDEKAVIASRGS